MIRILLDRAFDNERHYIHAVGLSTDTKPTTGIITGSKFVAVDTGAGYLFDETAGEWNENTQLSEAVAAWLDDHPEATTTVQDGSITKAKLDNSLQEAVDDVGELKSALSDIQTATANDVGKALSPKTVVDGAVTEWQFKNIGGSGGGLVDDVQIDGTSIVDGNGVANVPAATNGSYGVVKPTATYGVSIVNGSLGLTLASDTEIKSGASVYHPLQPSRQHNSAFYGLAKAAGDSTQSASANAVGTYTESAKSAIHTMLNGPVTVSGTTPTITALPGIQYVCGEVATLDITLPASGCVDVVFESGSTATVLTITPPTGVTVKWANGFDPTSLEANTTYEINIKDGLGVGAAWT